MGLKERHNITSIFLYGSLKSINLSKRRSNIIKEMAGLEILISKGILAQQAFDRLKALAEKLK